MNRIARFINDDQGADLIEYALLVGLITLAAVGSLTTVGGKISDMWKAIEGSITTAASKIPAQ
jgi:pilus assembly protein Flp/PilA